MDLYQVFTYVSNSPKLAQLSEELMSKKVAYAMENEMVSLHGLENTYSQEANSEFQ